MIENHQQYQVTRQQLSKLIAGVQKAPEPSIPQPNIHPRLLQASQEALQSLIDELKEEIAEYEAPWRELDESSILVRELLHIVSPEGCIVEPRAKDPDFPGGITAGLEQLRPSYGYPPPYQVFPIHRTRIIDNQFCDPTLAKNWDYIEDYVVPDRKIDWVISQLPAGESDKMIPLALCYAQEGVALLGDRSTQETLLEIHEHIPTQLKPSHWLSIENSELMWFVWQKNPGELIKKEIIYWQLVS